MAQKAPRQGSLTHGLRIGIVGGAIAGSAAAALLSRAGADVTVFERSEGKLEDRGVGLTIKISTIETLTARDLIDADMPHVPTWRRTFARPHKGPPPDDSPWDTFWEQPVAIHAHHWGELYRHLRQRVPDDIYRQGHEVCDLRERADGTVDIVLADGAAHNFDLAICADGHDSIGRKVLFPESEVGLTRYFTWRGMVDEWNVPRPELFDETIVFYGFDQGHAFIYFVPSLEHGGTVGKRRLNWAFQETITGKDIPGIEPDENGFVRKVLAPGAATPDQIAYCRRVAREYLPPYFGDIVDLTPQPFTQPIRETGVPGYVRGHICLVGDAGIQARPHVGAGASKAIEDALSLVDALASHATLDAALADWEAQRWPAGNELFELGQSLGKHQVDETPDWYAMDAAAMNEWWEEVVGGRYWFWFAEVERWHPTAGRPA